MKQGPNFDRLLDRFEKEQDEIDDLLARGMMTKAEHRRATGELAEDFNDIFDHKERRS